MLTRVTATPEKKQETAKRPPKKWFLILSSAPWLLIITAYLEALAASYALGHWPRPMRDDPKYLPAELLDVIWVLLLLGLAPAFFGLVFMTLSKRKTIQLRSFYSIGWVVFVTGALALYFLAQADPGRVWEWLLD
ncbi:MAG: hypothetical protein L0Z53_05335 [Acidobacteriales bacterium]|nr:hypothetical protein [Terriglobales bacterium]